MKTFRPRTIVEWAEVISAITVIITLFYVGYQVKQNTDAVKAVALNSVASDLNNLFLKGTEKEIATLLVKSQTGEKNLSEIEKEQLFRWYGLNVSIFEAAWRHKKHKRITQEYFDTMIPVICSTYSSEVGQDFWFVWKDGITQGYWNEITESCGFKKPDLTNSFYPVKREEPQKD